MIKLDTCMNVVALMVNRCQGKPHIILALYLLYTQSNLLRESSNMIFWFVASGIQLLFSNSCVWFSSTRSNTKQGETYIRANKTRKTKNNTPHKIKQHTKRELIATVTRSQEMPRTELRLKRDDYREFIL